MKKDFKILLRLFEEMKKYKLSYFLTILLMCINTLLSLLSPYIIVQIIDNALVNKDIKLLITSIVTNLLIFCISIFITLISNYIFSKILYKISFTYRYKCIKQLHKFSGEYYSNIKSGEILTILFSDISAIEHIASQTIVSLLSDIFVAIGFFIFLLYIQIDLAIIILIIIPILYFSQKYFQKKTKNNTEDARKSLGKLNELIQTWISSLFQIISINAQKYFFSKYFKLERDIIKKGIKTDMTFSLNSGLLTLLSNLLTLMIFGYGGYKVVIGTLTIGGLVAYNMYAQKLMAPILRISRFGMQLQQACVSLKRIYNLLDEPSVEINNLKNIEIKGNIQFKNVDFSYENTKVIDNLSIDMLCGEKTAIVGESGAGKSTLIQLLYQFWKIDKGQLFIDGYEVSKLDTHYLRKNISIISQEILLFDDTIYQNISLNNSIFSKNDVENAAKIANISSFIDELPEKYETIIGEKGIKLSGGQRQRIAIARAVLKNTPIIIFDEATSSLDQNTEFEILKNIYNNPTFHNKTVIVITHRLSSIDLADKIYLMSNGTVIESGDFDELMNMKKQFYELYVKNKKQIL